MNTAIGDIPQMGLDPVETLRALCGPLMGGAGIDPTCTIVQPNEIPRPQDALLVHHEHMTVKLEEFYGARVQVQILDEHRAGDIYTRKISLTTGVDRPVVEWGIVRLDFRFMSSAVRDEILAKQLPLGAILVKHDVHRRIKPRWFLKFPPTSPLLSIFDVRPDLPLYGRIGTIYCDEEPAIELLEIATGA